MGILGYSENGVLIESLTLELEPDAYNFSPKKKFLGTFYFKDEDITKYYKSHKTECVKLFEGDNDGALILNNVSAWFDVNEGVISAIELSPYKTYVSWEGIPEDKYIIKPINEEAITFIDFGFKLSIIEELMYTKGLLQPKFDI